MPHFDHNATAPLRPAARAAWLEANDTDWANPGGAYRAAARVRALIDRERGRLATLLGAAEARLVLTSGATEAANAILAHLAATAPAGALLLGPTEHSCVRAAATHHFPGRVELLPADRAGVVDRAALGARLASGGVAAVAVMAANNETGVLQPWREIAADCRAAGVPYVCDAVQWLGRLPAAGLGAADFLFASAHKFGGPKGAGFLLLPDGPAARGFAAQRGGGQQGGRRAGTEDWPALAALTAALAEAEAELAAGDVVGRAGWRDCFEADLQAALPGVRFAGAEAPRLWNTSLAVLPAGESTRWIPKLDRRGFSVSTTAACAAAQGHGSAVLAALGFAPAETRRALRFSAGPETTEADWRALAAAVLAVRDEIAAGGPVV